MFDIHEAEQIMTIAYYNGGVRVVDLSGLASGEGLEQVGFYQIQGMDSWSAKTPRIDARTGDFYLYGNDTERGLDVYRFDASAPESASAGVWLTPAQALARARARPAVALTPDTAFFCLLGPQ